MSTSEVPASGSASARADDAYLPIEDVATRLGLPLGLLLRRIEAGDVPARRVAGAGGAEWMVRRSDLGVEGSDEPEPEADLAGEATVVPAEAAPSARTEPPAGNVE